MIVSNNLLATGVFAFFILFFSAWYTDSNKETYVYKITLYIISWVFFVTVLYCYFLFKTMGVN